MSEKFLSLEVELKLHHRTPYNYNVDTIDLPSQLESIYLHFFPLVMLTVYATKQLNNVLEVCFLGNCTHDDESGILLFLKSGSPENTGNYLRGQANLTNSDPFYHKQAVREMIVAGDNFRSPLLNNWENMIFYWVCLPVCVQFRL